jgi:hypothetical protein
MEASLTSDEPLVVDETSEECRERGSPGRRFDRPPSGSDSTPVWSKDGRALYWIAPI